MGNPLEEVRAYDAQFKEDLAEAKSRFAIQRQFCWQSVKMKFAKELEAMPFDDRKKLEMAITNAPCVSKCQNFELYY